MRDQRISEPSVPRDSPRHSVWRGGTELQIQGSARYEVRDSLRGHDRTIQLRIAVNDEPVVDETLAPWNGWREFEARTQGVDLRLDCHEEPKSNTGISQIFRRVHVQGRPTVVLSINMTKADLTPAVL